MGWSVFRALEDDEQRRAAARIVTGLAESLDADDPLRTALLGDRYLVGLGLGPAGA